jgi:hypothetical protein
MIPRYTFLCVCYVEVWYDSPLYVLMCLLCGDLVRTDLSGYDAKCPHSAA